jgi:Asp-tRNA(Asn)/Glu-tRNA(Gln) amidotransferase A subunit family amidase
MNLLEASIETIQTLQANGKVTAVDLVQFYLDRIEQYDNKLNSIQTLNAQAIEIARALDDERAQAGPRSPLHGIPMLVKDNYETVGMPTSNGSALFSGFAPHRDAHLVERLKAAGAIIIGKTTMHEFAFGITTVGSAFGATRNPYNTDFNPGGSSGGTGAAVAANFAVAGMGSDTCGSIRIPAAHNNLVGLRGTQGLSSRRGIVPLSSTQDIGGPLAKTVHDLAIVLELTVGFDSGDRQTAESVGRDFNYTAKLNPRSDMRIGVLEAHTQRDEPDADVAAVIRTALTRVARGANWHITEVASPKLDAALKRPADGHFVLVHDFKSDIEAYLTANPELGYDNLAALLAADKHHPHIDGSLNAALAMTEDTDSTYYVELAQRRHVRRALLQIMAEHNLDALAYPTIRRTAVRVGEAVQPGTNCQLSANSGLPSISVPAGFSDDLPVGLEFLAEPWSEQKLLDLALTVETHNPQRRLPASTP